MRSRDGLDLLYTVLSSLIRWHPVYIYAYSPGQRPYVPFVHQVLLLHDNAVRPVVRVLIGDEVGLGKTAEAILTLRLLENRIRAEGREPRFLIIVPRILVEQWHSELVRAGVQPTSIRILVTSRDVEEMQTAGWPPGYYIGGLQLLRLSGNTERIVNADWDAVVIDEAHNMGIGPSFRNPNKSYLLVYKLTRPPERSVLLLSATPHRGKSRDYLARLMLLVPEARLYEIANIIPQLDSVEFYRYTHNTLVYRRTKEIVNKLEDTEVFRPAHMSAIVVNVGDDERQFENILTGFLSRKIDEWGKNIWSQGNPKGLLLALIRKRASSSIYAARRTLEAILRGLAVRGPGVSTEKLQQLSVLLSSSFDELEDDPEELLSSALSMLPPGLLSERDREDLKILVKLAHRIEERGETKLGALKSMIEEWVSKGKRVVVFTEYRDTVEYLYSRLRGIRVNGRILRIACVSGAPSGECARDRIEEIKRRLELGEIDVILATDVASEGLNLQSASVLVNYDMPWSPVKLEQRIGRVWRLGQKDEVHIFSLFRNTPSDLALVDKLYMKILAIKKAMGTARPMIGSRAEIYAEGEFISIDRLYCGGAPGASDAVADALGEVGELEIARAMIEGRLDEVAQRIIERINKLRYEIESKRIYPTEAEPVALRDFAEKYLGVVGPLDRHLLEQAKRLRKLADRDSPQNPWDAVLTYRSILAWLAREQIARALGTYRSPAVKGKLVLVPIQVKSSGKLLYEEFVGIDLAEGAILTGPKLLDKVLDIIEKGVVRESATPHLTHTEQLIALTRAKRIVRNRIDRLTRNATHLKEKLSRVLREELVSSFAPRLNVEASLADVIVIEKGDVEILIEITQQQEHELGQIHGTSRHASATRLVEVEDEDTLEEKLRLERKAIILVMKYEIDHGRLPKDVHDEKSYDIESINPVTGEVERYIEVKSHSGPHGLVELTEKEYEFARRHRDKYWLYLVIGLSSLQPKIITIHDPVSKLRLRRVAKKKIVHQEREEVRYIAEVDVTSADEVSSAYSS